MVHQYIYACTFKKIKFEENQIQNYKREIYKKIERLFVFGV